MPDGYGSQHDYMGRAKESADSRQEAIVVALREAFLNFIEKRQVEIIIFSRMSAFDLAKAISYNPVILKPLLACCNIAARAIERDLDIKNLDTYSPRINKDNAKVIAGYIKPFLPAYLELPALSFLDRVWFIDKEIRKAKGNWEHQILKEINQAGTEQFKKRTFEAGKEKFELDLATPVSGDIKIGIDVKRIEARRDIHKRCDEIVNKASKLKSAFPNAKFAAVIYYPFIDEHVNIQNRLSSSNVDYVVFASESDDSIRNAVKLLIAMLKAGKQ